MMEYLKSRNPDLDARFERIATEYMRHGEELGIRWDYAFFQMIVETGALSYKRGHRSGDVRPTQNNFAGLGATGRGEHGESFKDMSTGVRAHLEHLLLYAGRKLANPVAERTRKVQEWGVLTEWQQGFQRPITFADLSEKWAPRTSSYRKMLQAVAERFEEFCRQADPHPEYIRDARGQGGATVQAAATRAPHPATSSFEATAERPTGTELARRAIDAGKVGKEEKRAALGANEGASAYKLLNAPPAADQDTIQTQSIDRSAKAQVPATTPKIDVKTSAPPNAPAGNAITIPGQATTLLASAGGAAKPLAETPVATPQKCRVWTASYGGQKAMLIKSVSEQIVNYTVLDVNDGAEKREAEAFISAYAKNGAVAGEFRNQSQALEKAFELCPEG
jgi:hypothetical protein